MTGQSHAFGPFVFDVRRRVLLKRGSAVTIGQKCLVLLETLLAAEGRAVSKSELIEAAWQTGNIEESNLAVQIAALRKHLGKTRDGEEWITTVQRVGYQLANHNGAVQTPGNGNAVASPVLRDDRPSVAVLPFLNLSSDPEQDYFSDGVTGDIITELSRWRLLAVQSRAASFQYRGKASDIKQIARELNVRYIVEGSVRRMGDRIRVTVELIDGVSGNHVWAEKYDRELAEVFAVQDQVVRTIVGTLVGRIEIESVERVRRKPPSNLLAYECVLKGNALQWDDPAGASEAAQLFAKAIEIDPNYGFAHSMLAIMIYRDWTDDWSNSDVALQASFKLAKRAVELDSNDSTCFSILGIVYLKQRSFDLALQYVQRAVEINPNNQWNIADMGWVLIYTGQSEAAAGCVNRAREIDPYFDPPWSWSCLGLAYMVLRRYQEALGAFEHLAAHSYWEAALVAGCHAKLGDREHAADFMAKCLGARPDFSISRRMAKEPFKNPADAAHLAECLQLAGLPE